MTTPYEQWSKEMYDLKKLYRFLKDAGEREEAKVLEREIKLLKQCEPPEEVDLDEEAAAVEEATHDEEWEKQLMEDALRTQFQWDILAPTTSEEHTIINNVLVVLDGE